MTGVPSAQSSFRIALALCVVLAAGACQANKPIRARKTLEPLSAPAPSPPGDLDLAGRIGWWEDLIPTLAPEDRSEAYLRLGELRLESGMPDEARIAFNTARRGDLSRAEIAQTEYGLGRSYLLEREPGTAVSHFSSALLDLTGPTREECQFLYDYHRGLRPDTSDATLVARMRPYLAGGTLASARSRPASFALVDLDRSAWSASPTGTNRDPMGRIYRITVHHAAEPFYGSGRSDTVAEVRNIQSSHTGKGWADIGYHFLVDREGRIIEGRPLQYQGAHAGRSGATNHNTGNIGICLLGNFHPQPDRGSAYTRAQTPTSDQLSALARLLDGLRDEFSIRSNEVFGHQEFSATECPGSYLLSWVERYRRGERGHLGF